MRISTDDINTTPNYPVHICHCMRIAVFSSALFLPGGCATFSTEAGNQHRPETNDAGAVTEISHAEQVFRHQNRVADRSMLLLDGDDYLPDSSYTQIQQREEKMFEACAALNQLARIRQQNQSESWFLKLKILFSLSDCETAAKELDNYLTHIEANEPSEALGAL